MNIKNIIIGSTVAISSLFVGVAGAEARGCYRALAANEIANMIRGGATVDQAIDYAISEGSIDSRGCLTSTVGYMRSLPYVFGDVLR